MDVADVLIYDFPSFDTGLFAGAGFSMANGDAELVATVTGRDDVVLTFRRVRWHEFTALHNCTSDQVTSAYFKLVELKGSPSVAKYVADDRAGRKAYRELRHFRVFLDEHGCHELFAESATGVVQPPSSRGIERP